MNKAINHLEEHKIFDKNLNTYVVPLSVAQYACDLVVVDLGIEEVDAEIEKLGELIDNLYKQAEGGL